MPSLHWKHARQISQIISVSLFFLLALLTYRGFEALVPLDLYFRLDPLIALSAMLAGRVIVPTLLIAILAIALALVFGRAWCGWLCPLGAILDWFTPQTQKIVPTARALRAVKYSVLIMIGVAALLGNLSLLILDPITLLNRTFGGALVPAFNVILGGIEAMVYPLAPIAPAFDWIEQNFRGTILPAQQTFDQLGWMLALAFAAVIALNWVAPRLWCRALCPLGAIYALFAKISWLRPRAIKDCSHCAACMRVCPTGAIAVTKHGFTVDSAECVVCMDCVAACPESVIGITFGGGRATESATVNLSRRQFLASAAASVAGVALLRIEPAAKRDYEFLVRPPGAQANDFLAKCIRCGECSKICPTGAIQPSLLEAGLEGFWSPLLVPRLGYCDYACTACGQICPTHAIPALALDDKRKQMIGTAYIDQNRCIPWAMDRPCVVCEEMCPVPEKAVRLDRVDVITPDGKTVRLQRPRVLHDLCIGCGICEYQCPLAGPAAIRVRAPMQLPPLT